MSRQTNEQDILAGSVAANPLTMAQPAAWSAGLGFGSKKGLSGAERRANELRDRQRELNNGNFGALSPEELEILNTDLSSGRLENLTPDQLLSRYQTINQSGNQGFKDWYSGAAGENDPTYKYAYDTFKSTFGRDPNSSEFAQILPIFGGAEGRQRGAAAVASMYDAYKQSPEYLQGQAGQYSDQVGKMFQDTYGRAATAEELAHFGTQLAGGQDAYQLGNELKNTQEYQTNQDKQFRTGLASELEGYDTSFFNKAKENVISRVAGNWNGAGTSSAMDFALTDLMGQIAEKRGQYLAGISSQQYGGNKEAARQDYGYQRDRYFGDKDYDRNRRSQEEDYYRSRSDEDRDYQRQMNDYYNMIGRQNQSRGVLRGGDWLNVGLQGANAAASYYGGGKTNNNYYDYMNY